VPQWIHERAEHLMEKNPSMPKGMAFALATHQSHASGHTPKGYGTSEGKREAKKKYSEPKSHYEQEANPESKEASVSPTLIGFVDELEKIALSLGGSVSPIKTPRVGIGGASKITSGPLKAVMASGTKSVVSPGRSALAPSSKKMQTPATANVPAPKIAPPQTLAGTVPVSQGK